MKWVIPLLLLIMMPLAAAEFSFRYTGYTSGLMNLDGVNRLSYADDNVAGGFYNDFTHARLYGSQRSTSGLSYSVGWQRPLDYQWRMDDNGYYDKVYSYGDWTTTDIRVNNPGNYHFAISAVPVYDRASGESTYIRGFQGSIGDRYRPGYSPYMHPGYGSYGRSTFNTRYNAYHWSDHTYASPTLYGGSSRYIRTPGSSGATAWY